MFSRLFARSRHPRSLTNAEAVAERAERAKAPDRLVHAFSDFEGQDTTVRAAPLAEFEHLLSTHISDLRHELGFDAADFEAIVMPMVRRYLSWVHLLPASASHHHSRLGGLAIHGLHVATLAARAAHNSVFDFTTALVNDTELRAHRRPRWQLGAATAGLHHDVGKILIDQVVTDADTGAVWNPFVQDLLSWLKDNQVERYAMRFRPGDRLHRHESFSLLLMGRIAGPEVLGALSEFGRDILEAVTMSISGERDDPFGLRKLVHGADVDSSRHDREAANTYWSESGAASDPMITRLLDAATCLIQTRNWRVNRPGSPVWANQDGVYLLWPQAFNGMRQELLAKQNATGIPNDPTEVAEIFIRSRVARPRVLSNGQRMNLWSIILPEDGSSTDNQNKAFIQMMTRLGGVSSALYIPEISSVMGSTPVVDMAEIQVAKDPTLPDVQHPETFIADRAGTPPAGSLALGERETEGAEDTGAEQTSTEPTASPSARAPSPAADADSPTRQTPEETAAPAEEPPQASSSHTAVPKSDSPPPADLTEPSRRLLEQTGLLGKTLLQVAEAIAKRAPTYKPRDMIRYVDQQTVLMRWPQAIRDFVGPNLADLAKQIEGDLSLLAHTVKGQARDYSQYGIAISLRLNGSPWNVLALNAQLSEAFMVIAQSKDTSSDEEIPE